MEEEDAEAAAAAAAEAAAEAKAAAATTPEDWRGWVAGAMAPATQPRQSSGVVAAAALASAAASAAAAAAASASSSSTSASGMPSPFFPASKNLFREKRGDKRQLGAIARRRRVVGSSGIPRASSSSGLIHTLR